MLAPFVAAALILYAIRAKERPQFYPLNSEAVIKTRGGRMEAPAEGELERSPITIVSETGEVTVAEGIPGIPRVILSQEGFLPDTFPTDLITERDLIFDHSFRQEYDIEGYTYASVKYESKKSFEENKTHFAAYLQERSWEVLNRYEEDESFGVSAILGGDGISIAVVYGGVVYPDGDLKRFVSVQVSYYTNGAAYLTSLHQQS